MKKETNQISFTSQRENNYNYTRNEVLNKMQQLIKAVKKPKPNCGLQMDFTRLWKYTTVCD